MELQNTDKDTFFDNIKRTILRFPVAMVFWLGIICFATLLVNGLVEDLSPKPMLTETGYFILGGFMLSVIFHILTEDMKRKAWLWIVFGIIIILLALQAFYSDRIPVFEFILTMLSGFSTFIILNIVSGIIPFWKEKDDIASTNFTLSHICSAIILLIWSAIVGLILYILIAYIGYEVYDYDKSKELGITISICLTTIISMFIFLCRIPYGAEKYKREFVPHKLLDLTLRYIIIPLALCFITALYVIEINSLLKSSLSYKLTTFGVSYLMIYTTITYMLVYPIVNGGNNNKYYRWTMIILPILLLPLVVMHAICVINQITDYGISIWRLYNATLSLLYFIICLGAIITKKYIRFIPLSFCALLFVSSVQPFGYITIVRLWDIHIVEKALEEYPHTELPMSKSESYCWLISMPDEEACNVMEKLMQGDDIYRNQWDSIFTDIIWGHGHTQYYMEHKEEYELICEKYNPRDYVENVKYTEDNFPLYDKKTKSILSWTIDETDSERIPDNYHIVKHIKESYCTLANTILYNDQIHFKNKEYEFEMPYYEEAYYDNDIIGGKNIADNSECLLALTSVKLYLNQGWAYVLVDGYIYAPDEGNQANEEDAETNNNDDTEEIIDIEEE